MPRLHRASFHGAFRRAARAMTLLAIVIAGNSGGCSVRVPTCSPGRTEPCGCRETFNQGSHTCRADGTGWGPCSVNDNCGACPAGHSTVCCGGDGYCCECPGGCTETGNQHCHSCWGAEGCGVPLMNTSLLVCNSPTSRALYTAYWECLCRSDGKLGACGAVCHRFCLGTGVDEASCVTCFSQAQQLACKAPYDACASDV